MITPGSEEADSLDVCQLYVDEAGTPDIFDAKGRINIGEGGCSHFFMLGMLEVREPERLANALTQLREDMVRDPYFSSLPSFEPTRKKTAVMFHAKNDVVDVRVKVFDVLRSFGSSLKFRAVVCDKQTIRVREESKRQENPTYRYKPDSLYDELATGLYSRFTLMADQYLLYVAKRGAKDRNAALLAALEQAEESFKENFGFSRGGKDAWKETITNPERTICLQAADYFMWALQRFYEPRLHEITKEVIHEDRYLNAMWPQISQVHDMSFGPTQGTFFTQTNRLTLDARFGLKEGKKKKP